MELAFLATAQDLHSGQRVDRNPTPLKHKESTKFSGSRVKGSPAFIPAAVLVGGIGWGRFGLILVHPRTTVLMHESLALRSGKKWELGAVFFRFVENFEEEPLALLMLELPRTSEGRSATANGEG